MKIFVLFFLNFSFFYRSTENIKLTTKLERNVSVGLHDSKTESMLYAAVRSVNGDLVGVIQVVNKTAVNTTSSTEVITEAKTEAKTASEKKTDKIIIPFDSAGKSKKL